MTVGIEGIERSELPDLAPAIGAVYQQAFGASDDQTQWFIDQQLLRHGGYAGFRGRIARIDGRVVGFTYGYESTRGHWWHDTVRPAIEQAGHGWWLNDAFELVELAVDPTVQGTGIGGRLHDALLRDVSQRTALLSTAQPPTNATHLYLRRGWVPLIDDFRYVPDGEKVVLLGLRLPLEPGLET